METQNKIDVAIYEAMIKESTPGRFEGEKPETAYFHEAYLDGGGEDFYLNGVYYSVFEVSKEEKEVFNLKEPFFVIYQTESGFIAGRGMSAKQWEKNQELAEKEIEEGEETED